MSVNPYSPPSATTVSVQASRFDSSNLLQRCWAGREDLWKVFWLFGVLGFIGLAVARNLLASAVFPASIFVGYAFIASSSLIHLIYLTFTGISIWRCARNSSKAVWGVLARVHVGLCVLTTGVNFASAVKPLLGGG